MGSNSAGILSNDNNNMCYKDYVSIVISVHNKLNELRTTLQDLIVKTNSNYEIIIISAKSTDGTDEIIPLEFPGAKFFSVSDIGWGEANNIGALFAKGDFLFFCGSDMQFQENWLNNLIEAIKAIPQCGSVGPLIIKDIGNKGFIETGAVDFIFNLPIYKTSDVSAYKNIKNAKNLIEVGAVFFPLIRKDVFFELGGFDPYYFYLVDDPDFGFRLKKNGLRNYICRQVQLYTDKTNESEKTVYFRNRNRLRMVLKYGKFPLVIFPIFQPFVTLIRSVLEAIIERNIRKIKKAIDGVLWNLKNIKETRDASGVNFLERQNRIIMKYFHVDQ